MNDVCDIAKLVVRQGAPEVDDCKPLAVTLAPCRIDGLVLGPARADDQQVALAHCAF